MALKASRGGREYDKFVADSGGDTALRTTSTSSVTAVTSSYGASATVPSSSSGAVDTIHTGVGTILLGKGTASADVNVSVAGNHRIGIQIFNTDSTNFATYKVWGNLVAGSTGDVAITNYTQIGDDIVVAAGASAYRAISTTPIYNIGVTGKADTATVEGSNVYIMAD